MKHIIPLSLLLLGCEGTIPGDPNSLMCFVNFDQDRTSLVIDAADEWSDRTGGQISLRFESATKESACSFDSVKLRLQAGLRGFAGEPALGVTVDDGEWIAFESDPEWLYLFRHTALHELGHYLTGLDHSDNPRDIMYPEWTEYKTGHLTDSDVARFYHQGE